MKRITKGLIFYQFLSCSLKFAAAGSIKTWTFDLLNLTTTTSNTDMVDLELYIHRLGRGRYGVSGFVDIKQSFGDEVMVEFSVKRSLRKAGPYTTLPFVINDTLSAAINNYYKPFIVSSAKKCCENCPEFKDKFVPPLNPVRGEAHECVMSTDDLPSIMMEGYYWVQLHIRTSDKGEKVSLVWQTYVEANKFF